MSDIATINGVAIEADQTWNGRTLIADDTINGVVVPSSFTPISTSYVGKVSQTPNQSSYTFTSAGIGAADADRIVICACHSKINKSTMVLNSATIGGSAATILHQITYDTSADGIMVGFFGLAVPAGTTATIVINYNQSALDGIVHIWRMIGGSLSAYDTLSAKGNATVATGTIDCEEGGVIFAANSQYDDNRSCSWTGVTEDYDGLTQITRSTGGHVDMASAEVGRTITATLSGSVFQHTLGAISISPV